MTTTQIESVAQSPVFILGCQRSGTTWLANIFDASPDTIFFMEPFAPPTGIFPEVPDTNTFLEGSSDSLDELLCIEMPKRLLYYKALLSKRSIDDPRWFKAERQIALWVKKYKRYVKPYTIRQHVNRFYALNYNRMDNAFPIYPKNKLKSAWVIKDLRLAGKLPVFLHALPSAHYITIIRHPFATVQSILKLLKRNVLWELRQDLESYVDRVDAQSISDSYKYEIEICRHGNLAHTVALYWRISYETMFRQLAGNSHAHFVVYEQLATDPRNTISDLFMQTGIPWSNSVDEYISLSTNKEVNNPGPIMTMRKSDEYYRAWLKDISDEDFRAVQDIVGDSFLMSQFDPYYGAS